MHNLYKSLKSIQAAFLPVNHTMAIRQTIHAWWVGLSFCWRQNGSCKKSRFRIRDMSLNSELKVRCTGRSGSVMVIEIGTNRKPGCGFLRVVNSITKVGSLTVACDAKL